jgi:hypothetical protein
VRLETENKKSVGFGVSNGQLLKKKMLKLFYLDNYF